MIDAEVSSRDWEAGALLVVDVQAGFEDEAWWGGRNNPDADDNISSLVRAFVVAGRPVIFVQHQSLNPESPLSPLTSGHRLKPYLEVFTPDLLVTKTVNSSFHGSPDLHQWLGNAGITTLAIIGISTNHCCETTARLAGNLGYNVFFVLDATYTFDRTGPDETIMTADELARATAINLHEEFATVVDTATVLRSMVRLV